MVALNICLGITNHEWCTDFYRWMAWPVNQRFTHSLCCYRVIVLENVSTLVIMTLKFYLNFYSSFQNLVNYVYMYLHCNIHIIWHNIDMDHRPTPTFTQMKIVYMPFCNQDCNIPVLYQSSWKDFDLVRHSDWQEGKFCQSE